MCQVTQRSSKGQTAVGSARTDDTSSKDSFGKDSFGKKARKGFRSDPYTVPTTHLRTDSNSGQRANQQPCAPNFWPSKAYVFFVQLVEAKTSSDVKRSTQLHRFSFTCSTGPLGKATKPTPPWSTKFTKT